MIAREGPAQEIVRIREIIAIPRKMESIAACQLVVRQRDTVRVAIDQVRHTIPGAYGSHSELRVHGRIIRVP